jgi:hypothetical protein
MIIWHRKDGANPMLKLIWKKLLLWQSCWLLAMTLVTIAFARGLLSGRQLAISVLLLGVAIGLSWVLVIKSAAKSLKTSPGNQDTSICAVTRKHHLLAIRRSKISIAVLLILLVLGLVLALHQDAPLFPTLAGAGVNVCMILALLQNIARLKRDLQ